MIYEHFVLVYEIKFYLNSDFMAAEVSTESPYPKAADSGSHVELVMPEVAKDPG